MVMMVVGGQLLLTQGSHVQITNHSFVPPLQPTSSINFMLHNSFIKPSFLNMSAQDVQALLRLMTTGRNKLTLALAMQRMKTLQTAGLKR
jgi:hypothetical protein